MTDVWDYSDMMKSYIIDKYGFSKIKAAKRVDDNVLIFLCYYANSDKIYRHEFTYNEINIILKLREHKNNKKIIDKHPRLKPLIREDKLKRILNDIHFQS